MIEMGWSKFVLIKILGLGMGLRIRKGPSAWPAPFAGAFFAFGSQQGVA